MAQLSLRDAILATIAYADIFGYPLTAEQLRTWLLYKPSPNRLHMSTVQPVRIDGTTYYGLSRVKQAIHSRRKRAAWSQTKLFIARRIAGWFRIVPTIMLVGVTGGLAMQNAEKDDDIDLFFITRTETLWISRLLVTMLAEVLAIRRRPGDANVKNKICLNMFMAEDALSIPGSERDVFAAHEVLQMEPLWDREGMYEKFLKANRWVKKFLPNAWGERYQGVGIRYYGKKQSAFTTLIPNTSTLFLRLFEPVVKYVQLLYMRRRRTNEVISNSIIRFHPRDARVWVRDALAARLGRYNIPLDKVFYGR